MTINKNCDIIKWITPLNGNQQPLLAIHMEVLKNMYAVIKTGGKQYKLQREGDVLRVKKLEMLKLMQL